MEDFWPVLLFFGVLLVAHEIDQWLQWRPLQRRIIEHRKGVRGFPVIRR